MKAPRPVRKPSSGGSRGPNRRSPSRELNRPRTPPPAPPGRLHIPRSAGRAAPSTEPPRPAVRTEGGSPDRRSAGGRHRSDGCCRGKPHSTPDCRRSAPARSRRDTRSWRGRNDGRPAAESPASKRHPRGA